MVHSPSKEDNYGVCLHLFIFILTKITGNRIGCPFCFAISSTEDRLLVGSHCLIDMMLVIVVKPVNGWVT
jgi:hypothetical protein